MCLLNALRRQAPPIQTAYLFRKTAMTKNSQLVYCKTAKGREEILARQHALQFRQRNTLILMDCAKNLGLIATAIPFAELEKTVPFLMQNGFIVLASALPEQTRPPAVTPNQNRTDDTGLRSGKIPAAINAEPTKVSVLTRNPDALEKVKNFMITASNTYLGLMGAGIISRIQICHTAEQLMAVAGFWNMAFRESKQGGPVASIFLEQVKLELKHGQ